MSGLVFFSTNSLEKVKEHYIDKIGMKLWLQQACCIILNHGNFLLGFCERETEISSEVITLFYNSREEVDQKYEQFKDSALEVPKYNELYKIYNFFTKDFEGRLVEFQYFCTPMEPYYMGNELLKNRRSIRKFTEQDVSSDLMKKVYDDCRYSPTSMNSQSYYFIEIRSKELLSRIASERGQATAPIANAPLAVAICATASKTKRVKQDGDIAAYHFILSAWNYNLGTCWMADMDRENLKEMLNIPQDDYIATITPVGFFDTFPKLPKRREIDEFIQVR